MRVQQLATFSGRSRSVWLRLVEYAVVLSALTAATGCVTPAQINIGFRKIDNLWRLENQRRADELRYRVVEAPVGETFIATRNAFIDVGLPIHASSVSEGVIRSEVLAPSPLTQEEWEQVADAENPRVREVAGWIFYISDNPEGYIVVVEAHLAALDSFTVVQLHYRLRMPEYEALGYEPNEVAPPKAVEIASLKIWQALQARLLKIEVPAPRRRDGKELHTGVSDPSESHASLGATVPSAMGDPPALPGRP